MEKTITPSAVGGTIAAPPSKSMGVRVAAAMALAGMQPTPREGDSGDVRAATRAAREWLAGSRTLHVGESALAANIFGCIAALSPDIMTITAEKTLLKRDMRELVHALRDARVGVRSEKFPMQLHGPMRGGSIRIFGPGSSQVVTGLLMALPLAPHDSVLEVRRPSSTPYIYMTLDLLKQCGIEIELERKPDYGNLTFVKEEREGWIFSIRGGQKYSFPTDYVAEGDWSGASCLLAAGDVTVRGLSEHSLQADRAIVDALRLAGAEVAFDGDAVTVRRGEEMRGFQFDATHCPDLFPALVALAASCKGTSVFSGAVRLLNKESSRGRVMRQEYAKMGIRVTVNGNELCVYGGTQRVAPRGGVTVCSHGDHRIAMSLAVTALRATEPVVLEGADAVTKSYPAFWRDFEKLKG